MSGILVGVVGSQPTYVPPTGGTITTSGGYTIHTFANSGTFEVFAPTTVEFLLVGGGDSGKRNATTNPFGGNGGRLFTSSATLNAGSYSVVVGSGGAGNTTQNLSNPGSSSTFNGQSSTSGSVAGAGGAVRGSAGNGIAGSNGTANSYSGASVTYGGGGGGGAYSTSNTAYTGGAGGASFGGAGGVARAGTINWYADPGADGQPGGGGGGGGGISSAAGSARGGSGGKGIVIIRFVTI